MWQLLASKKKIKSSFLQCLSNEEHKKIHGKHIIHVENQLFRSSGKRNSSNFDVEVCRQSLQHSSFYHHNNMFFFPSAYFPPW